MLIADSPTNHNMKILFYIDTFLAGGKERRLLELMKGLKKNPDIQFELVLMDKNIHYQEVFELDIKIHYLIRKKKKDLTIFRKLYAICKNYKPDFVHCWDSMSAIYLIPVLKVLNIKFINGMITDAPGVTGIRNKFWRRAQLTFPFSNVIIGNSRAGLAAYNAPALKSICIHNGFNFNRINTLMDADQIKEQLDIKTKYIIGMVASFSRYKDYETYFAAAQSLLAKRKDITFLAIGSDTNSPLCKNLIDERYLKHFKLLGKRSDVESLVDIMDITILSTFTEGISNSILEYMALSKPVIATAGGGTGELIEDKKTGFLVNPLNSEELAEKIEILLNDDNLRIKMGIAGRERIVNHFSINKMVDEFVVHYRRVAEDNFAS